MKTDYEAHPAANIFPMLDEQALSDLASSIAKHGLLEPIMIHEGMVLDGRNRLAACKIAGVDPAFLFNEVEPGCSPVHYVLNKNLHRRHLTASQRAMVGAAAKGMFEAEAKERQGTRTDIRANLRERSRKAADDAAQAVNVSPRSIEHASKVQRDGVPELQEAVRGGNVSVSAASAIAKMPPEEQVEAVKKTRKKRETKQGRQRAYWHDAAPQSGYDFCHVCGTTGLSRLQDIRAIGPTSRIIARLCEECINQGLQRIRREAA